MIECCMRLSSISLPTTSMVDFNVHLYFCPIIGVCVIHVCSDTDKKLQLTFFVLHLEFLTLIIWHLLWLSPFSCFMLYSHCCLMVFLFKEYHKFQKIGFFFSNTNVAWLHLSFCIVCDNEVVLVLFINDPEQVIMGPFVIHFFIWFMYYVLIAIFSHNWMLNVLEISICIVFDAGWCFY